MKPTTIDLNQISGASHSKIGGSKNGDVPFPSPAARSVFGDDPDRDSGPKVLGALRDRSFEVRSNADDGGKWGFP